MYLGPLQMSDIIMITIAIGAIILIIGFNIGRRFRSSKTSTVAELKVKSTVSKSVNYINSKIKVTPNNTVVNSNSAGNGKKRAKNKKRREVQQDFTHKWMIGALKGHTATVLDMNFSSNGKFLASCAEDCGLASRNPANGSSNSSSSSSSSSNNNRGNIPKGKKSPQHYTVSRKMAKWNQHHENLNDRSRGVRTISSSSSISSTASDTSVSTEGSSDTTWLNDEEQNLHSIQMINYNQLSPFHSQGQLRYNCNPLMTGVPGMNYSKSFNNQRMNNLNTKFNHNNRANVNYTESTTESTKKVLLERAELSKYTDAQLYECLIKYILSLEQLKRYGYPEADPSIPGRATFNHYHYPRVPEHVIEYHKKQSKSELNVNAREFIPSCYNTNMNDADSGTGSGDSLENSDFESEGESSRTPSETDGDIKCIFSKTYSISKPITKIEIKKQCGRCQKIFYTDIKGMFIVEDICYYHSGRYHTDGETTPNGLWTCCNNGDYKHPGCNRGSCHLINTWEPGFNSCDGFIQTQPLRYPARDGNYGIYGIDCEMCNTTLGQEVTRISIVDIWGSVTYNTFVKPYGKITDFLTEHSGITKESLVGVTTTLADVQRYMMTIISSQTILIGQGLENDLRALRIVHSKVIDTGILFKDKYMPAQYHDSLTRLGLKKLVSKEFQMSIQVGTHDSIEDAQIVVALALRKTSDDLKGQLKTNPMMNPNRVS